jgi:purine-binding chemotaxis protein CheW
VLTSRVAFQKTAVTTDNPNPTSDGGDDQSNSGRSELHDLLPFTLGEKVFAVFTDEVEATAEAKPFARLPRAPNSVIGIVCVRGRMLTVIDPAVLLDGESCNWTHALPCVIALRSEEQLALVAETYRDTITIADADIERATEAPAAGDQLVIGHVVYASERIAILNTSRLFGRVVQRRDRRRRRF